MNKYINSEASQHEMKLVQMGAKVEQINSKMCYVKFNIGSLEVAYVYNINKNGQYFLERIKPYPLAIKAFESEADVINLIEVDKKQFENAVKSKNIDSFIKISSNLHNAIKEFEDLYLYYNVPGENTNIILEKLNAIHKEIAGAKNKSQRIFIEKEPENLK